LAKAFRKALPNFWEREQKFSDVLVAMESRGILIDQEFCRRQIGISESICDEIFFSIGRKKPTSRNDLIDLFKMIELPLLPEYKTKTGAPSFDKTAMAEYDAILQAREDMGKNSDVAQKILRYRGWAHVRSNNYIPYLNKLSPDGRLRTNYNRNGTKNGRLSSNDPNLQNIPKDSQKEWNGDLKFKAFKAKPGFVLAGRDYSQLEYRLGSGYAEQWNIIDVFNRSKEPEMWTEEDRDVFWQLCKQFGIPLTKENRSKMKTTTYAKLYLASMLKVAITLGENIPQAVVDAYFNRNSPHYAQAHAYVQNTEAGKFYAEWEAKHDRMVEHARQENAYAKRTMRTNLWSGRVRRYQFASETRKAYNSLVQGGGAEIVQSAMIRLFEEVDNPDCRMLLQVHDSILFEIRESQAERYLQIIGEIMSEVEKDVNFDVYFATESEYWTR